MSEKNYDPQIHSAEHILNGTMSKMFNVNRAFSAHIEKKKSKCDYKGFSRNLSDDEIKTIQDKVNVVIKQNLDVKEKFLTRIEAQTHFNLARLPEDAGENIRIITIGDYDACPCIGPHVSNTSEIGDFQIISSSFENDILRVRFKIQRP